MMSGTPVLQKTPSSALMRLGAGVVSHISMTVNDYEEILSSMGAEVNCNFLEGSGRS